MSKTIEKDIAMPIDEEQVLAKVRAVYDAHRDEMPFVINVDGYMRPIWFEIELPHKFQQETKISFVSIKDGIPLYVSFVVVNEKVTNYFQMGDSENDGERFSRAVELCDVVLNGAERINGTYDKDKPTVHQFCPTVGRAWCRSEWNTTVDLMYAISLFNELNENFGDTVVQVSSMEEDPDPMGCAVMSLDYDLGLIDLEYIRAYLEMGDKWDIHRVRETLCHMDWIDLGGNWEDLPKPIVDNPKWNSGAKVHSVEIEGRNLAKMQRWLFDDAEVSIRQFEFEWNVDTEVTKWSFSDIDLARDFKWRFM